jgi:hypothetical protein
VEKEHNAVVFLITLIVNWVKAAWQRLFGKKTAAPTTRST